MSTAKSIISFFFEHNLPKPKLTGNCSYKKSKDWQKVNPGWKTDFEGGASERSPLSEKSLVY